MSFVSDTLLADGTRSVEYVPQGVCSVLIQIDVKDDIIRRVAFTKGCNGNSKGMGALIEGMNIHEAIRRLEGIVCGTKATSCPDQLSKAMREIVNTGPNHN